MKRGLIALTLMVPLALHAQDAAGVDELRTQLRGQTTAAPQQQQQPSVTIRTVNSPTTIVAAPSTNSLPSNATDTTSDAYKSNSYQTQPTTLVEDAPYQDSKASAVRKKRQSIEDQTENKIVEKLEVERTKDEERRANKILTTMDSGESAPVVVVTPPPAPVVAAPVPVVVAAPAPVVAPAPAPAVVIAPVSVAAPAPQSSFADIEDVKIQDKSASRFFVGGYGGVGEYPGANNVRGRYGLGFNVGVAFPDRLILDAGYTYSVYDVDNSGYGNYTGQYFNSPYLTQMNQSNVSLGLKYQVLETRVRPVVGVLLDYTHRSYQQTVNGTTFNTGNNNNNPTSNAFDAGFLVGLDVAVTEAITVGVDWRYMMNLTYSSNTPVYFNSYNNGSSPIEQLSYYLIGLNARFSF